jgi:hypothetical protein
MDYLHFYEFAVGSQPDIDDRFSVKTKTFAQRMLYQRVK